MEKRILNFLERKAVRKMKEFKDKDFHKSSFCVVATSIEVASDEKVVAIRDSKKKENVQYHTKDDWDVFVKGVKAGEFD
jgi:allophanate hydrolase subunit 1